MARHRPSHPRRFRTRFPAIAEREETVSQGFRRIRRWRAEQTAAEKERGALSPRGVFWAFARAVVVGLCLRFILEVK